MKRALSASLTLAFVLLVLGGCSSSKDLTKSETQEDFGVRMARMNLWREALFRFKRAVDIDPADALAHNNLAVAYEANGDFDSALREYREAMRLDRSNQYIQKNYSRFVEFTSRNKKRQRREAAPTRTATTATTPADGDGAAAAPAAPPAAPPPTPPPPEGAKP